MLSLKSALTQVANWIKGVNDFVIEQQITNNGTTGYTKWNSGKLEQWGVGNFTASSGEASTTVTFPTKFANTNYNFICSGNRNFLAAVTGLYECDSDGNVRRTVSSTMVVVKKSGAAYVMAFDYMVIGKWK